MSKNYYSIKVSGKEALELFSDDKDINSYRAVTNEGKVIQLVCANGTVNTKDEICVMSEKGRIRCYAHVISKQNELQKRVTYIAK